jgi:hypothetical protein
MWSLRVRKYFFLVHPGDLSAYVVNFVTTKTLSALRTNKITVVKLRLNIANG